MISEPRLSESQIDDFERNGLLVVRGAFDAEAMTIIDRWAREV